jgi:hypothetical protein
VHCVHLKRISRMKPSADMVSIWFTGYGLKSLESRVPGSHS